MACLGIVAVVLGILLAAQHGNEWMKQIVVAQSTPEGGAVPAAVCPADELEEEGLSLAECEQLNANVRNLIVSSPEWFPGFQAGLAAVGTLAALISVLVGAALLNARRWARAAAIATFGILAAIDAAGFVGVVNTGPILRDMYLANFLLWFSIHLMMTVGAVAGPGIPEAAAPQPGPDRNE